jgi:hypothetical protein
MKRMRMSGVVVAVLVGVILMAGSALAQDKPDATLTFTGGSVAAGVGWSWGSGVLTYQGKEYPFSVEGLAVGGTVGGASVSAKGDVYSLKSLEDFSGNFTAAAAGMTIGGGAEGTAMKNEKGVVVKLVSTTVGLTFNLSTAGVKFELKK